MKYLIITIVSALIGLGGASAAQSPLHRSTRSAARVRIPAKCSGVTMHLEPGVLNPDGSPWKGWVIAKDIPLDAVTADAPLYPGALASHAPLAQNIFFAPRISDYIKSAVAEFSLPAGVGPALRWYRKAFPACGFVPDGVTGGAPTTAVEFVSPTTPSLDVLVSLQAVSPHSSLVLYYASAVSTPKRPARSEISGNVTSATVTYWDAGSKRVRITLRNPSVIQGLVAVIGPAPLIALTGCLFRAEAGSAVVVFHQPGGATQRLVVSPDCYFTANGSGRISDVDHPVWSYVSYVVYKHCFQYGCPSLR